MSSVKKKLVCIICLKRFILNDSDNENKSWSGNDDSYTKFLLFISRYFKLKSLTDRFLKSAKQAKVQNGDEVKLHAFCDHCGELVASICKIYKELQATQMFLVWKLGEVGDVLKMSTKSVSYKLSRELLFCMAKQIKVKAARPVDILRKSIQLKCIAAQRKSMPIIPVHKGLFPEEWKFTYDATKEALIRLIVVFTVGSDELSKQFLPFSAEKPEDKREPVKIPANLQSKDLQPKKVAKSSQEDVTNNDTVQKTVETEKNIVKVENVAIDIHGTVAGEDDDNDYVNAPNNLGNAGDSDCDWSRGAPSPMSVDALPSDDDSQSKEPPPITRWNLRSRRKIMVKAEEVEGANSEASDISGDEDSKLKFLKSLKQGQLKCSKCPKSFKYRRALATHLYNAHRIHIEQFCEICGILFENLVDLRAHMKEMHAYQGYSRTSAPTKSNCPKCSTTFPTRLELWRHFKKVHKAKTEPGQKKRKYDRIIRVDPFYTVKVKGPRYRRKGPHTEKDTQKARRKVKSYFCSVENCGASFTSYKVMLSHLESVHETGKPEVEKIIYCCYCSEHYAYQLTLDMHIQATHKSKMKGDFKCDLEKCGNDTGFISVEELNEHLKTHSEVGEISFCEKCNWGFMRPEVRDLHQLVHIPASPLDGFFQCPQCPETYGPGMYHLQIHYNKMHGLDLRPYKCDMCDNGYFLKFMLDHHKSKHTKKPKLAAGKAEEVKCHQCRATFLDRTQFELHFQERHDPRFLLNCPEPNCGQKFNTSRKLSIHMTMKHVGITEREWICELCAASFPNKNGLQKHSEIHGERKYSCETCGASFKRKDKLALHNDSKHNPNRVKSWVCSLCGKSYHSETGLQYHTDSEHKKESEWHLKCPHCPKRFYRTMYLHRHLKTCKEGESTENPGQTTEDLQGQVQSKMESMDTFAQSSNVDTQTPVLDLFK